MGRIYKRKHGFIKYHQGTIEEFKNILINEILTKKYNFSEHWTHNLIYGKMQSLAHKRSFKCKFQRQYCRHVKYRQ